MTYPRRVVFYASPAIDVLPQFVIERRRISMKLWRQVGKQELKFLQPAGDAEIAAALHAAAAVRPAALLNGRSVPGEKLRPDLAGRVFTGMSEVALDLDAELGRGELVPYSIFVFAIDPARSLFRPVINRFAATTFTKARNARWAESNDLISFSTVTVPFPHYTINDCSISVGVNPALGILGPLKPTETRDLGVFKDNHDLPEIVVAGENWVMPDDRVVLDVHLSDRRGGVLSEDVDLYAETTAGYLANPRVQLVKGRGRLSVRALDLARGDSIRVKLGFRHVSGLAEHSIQVI